MKIEQTRVNCMGTLSITARFAGMRKSQEFILYPIKAGADTSRVMIQSDTRIGYIYLDSGRIALCTPVSGGAYQPHLMFVNDVDTLDASELAGLKFRLVQTASDRAGRNGVMVTDNSDADKVEIFASK